MGHDWATEPNWTATSGFPGGASDKEPACQCKRRDVRHAGLIPGLEGSPGERNINPLQSSCLENSMDRGVWQATGHRAPKTWTWLKQLSTHAHTTPLEVSRWPGRHSWEWERWRGGLRNSRIHWCLIWFRMGNTCTPMADSSQCMAKQIQICKVK